MNLVLLTALALQVRATATVQRDSTDSAKVKNKTTVTVGVGQSGRREREPRRIPVTEEHLRTAFKSREARRLFMRARASRLSQDSALMSYEAKAYLRISAGMSFARIGRDRLIFRHENVTNVRWHRDVGAWIDVKGARTALPVAPDEAQKEVAEEMASEGDMSVVPYHPGQEPLMSFNGESIKSQVDERDMVHPLAEGAEAYYTYAAGDSVVFRLPDGKTISLQELYVRPRQSKWNVAVGSLWFDAASGQLVRAAYRLAVPMDVWAIVKEEDPKAQDEIPVWVKPMISPMRAQISMISVEYGLYNARFWLPRLRSAEGDAQVSFMRVPFKFEQSFKYASVNAIDSLPPIRLAQGLEPPDSLTEEEVEKWRDSVREARAERRRAERDSIREGLKKRVEVCDTAKFYTVTRRDTDIGLRVAVRVPCDVEALAKSPDLPKSIYDPGEEIFGSKERDALIKEALAMGAQPPFAIGAIPPTVKYGLEFTRFNRVEGLSSAAVVEQNLGAGYTASLLARLGTGDLEPYGELTLSRTNLSKTIRGRVYNRLVAANDWGNPLSFGASLSAALFGRDEGFYYRTTGAELEWVRERGGFFTYRLFAERQRNAAVEVTKALGPAFIPNVTADAANYAGIASRFIHTLGLDPQGFRMFTDARVEGAARDSASQIYGRGAIDLTFTRGIGRYATALTLSGGSSVGNVPAQRQWFLGGAHTVRGQRADTAISGNAFWLGRLEVGTSFQAVRPVVFADMGWTGHRDSVSAVGRPLSGAGIGASILDGLMRFDLARGFYPEKKTRLYMYLDAKF